MNDSSTPLELFRDDATRLDCEARITAVHPAGSDAEGRPTSAAIELDRTVFYPQGGGQAGDAGRLLLADGRELTITDTRKARQGGGILHLLAPDTDLAGLAPGQPVQAHLDAARRHAHMRFHTATHLLCALVPHPVDGCSITASYARLDFHMTEPLDKEALTAGLMRLVQADHPVQARWITEAELDANPGLVRSMSVQPPRGLGRIRVIDIEGVDLQPCGGTHVSRTGEIGALLISKIEKKSASTRRVVLQFAS